MPEYNCAWEPGHDDCRHEQDEDCGYWECEHESGESGWWLGDHTDLLEWGFDGSSYERGSTDCIVHWNGSDVDADWKAVPLTLADLPDDAEQQMRAEAEHIGMKLPTTPAGWILWPHEG